MWMPWDLAWRTWQRHWRALLAAELMVLLLPMLPLLLVFLFVDWAGNWLPLLQRAVGVRGSPWSLDTLAWKPWAEIPWPAIAGVLVLVAAAGLVGEAAATGVLAGIARHGQTRPGADLAGGVRVFTPRLLALYAGSLLVVALCTLAGLMVGWLPGLLFGRGAAALVTVLGMLAGIVLVVYAKAIMVVEDEGGWAAVDLATRAARACWLDAALAALVSFAFLAAAKWATGLLLGLIPPPAALLAAVLLQAAAGSFVRLYLVARYDSRMREHLMGLRRVPLPYDHDA